MPADVIARGRSLSGPEMAERAERLAGGWYAMGVREGDVVALLLRNSVEFLDAILACRLVGCYYCPLNWHFTTNEIAFILEDSGARLLVADADLLDKITDALPADMPLLCVGDSSVPHTIAYEAWLDVQSPYDGPLVPPRAHMAYTSGTTGKPKGVLRQPAPISATADAGRITPQRIAELAFGLVPGTRALMPAPIYHSGPSVFAQTALQNSELFVLMERFDPEGFLQMVEQHRIDTSYLVPIMYVRLLQLPQATREAYDTSSLRFIGSTGAPCAPEVKRAIIEWLGPVIFETYGSSEAGMLTLAEPAHALERPGTAGLALPGSVIRVLDDQFADCPPGTIGRVYVRQTAYPDFTYRNRPEARAEIEHDGLVCLGDMGYLDADGYLFLCDRSSNMVISGGVNIYPAEIEQQLLQYPGIADCVVFGIPDAEYGERLMAMVQPRENHEVNPANALKWLSTRLARFKIPKHIEVCETLPRDENGKIATRRLRDKYWEGQQRRI